MIDLDCLTTEDDVNSCNSSCAPWLAGDPCSPDDECGPSDGLCGPDWGTDCGPECDPADDDF